MEEFHGFVMDFRIAIGRLTRVAAALAECAVDSEAARCSRPCRAYQPVAWARAWVNPTRSYMMVPVVRFVDCYVLPPGRGIHALERVVAMATALGLTRVAARAQAGIAEYRKVKDLQIRLRTIRPGLYGEGTSEIDTLLDRCLTSVDSYLDSQITLLPADHVRAVAAGAIRPALFPEGVQAITRQSYVQQRVDVDHMIATFESPSLAPARVDLPDLTHMMAHVAELNRKYAESIDAYDRGRPSPEALRAAQDLAHTMLLETVVLILAEHLESAPELRDSVAALLEPIERQNEAVRATRRRRRPPTDIDPGTGIEVPEDGVPAAQPGDAAAASLPG
jgi:hypothetical protein